MSIETVAFNSIYDHASSGRYEIKRGRDVIEKAFSSGLTVERMDTEYGILKQIDGELRFLKSDEPAQGLSIGDKIEVRPADGTWMDARIGGIYTQGGVVRLILEAVND